MNLEHWNYYNPVRIVFAAGALSRLGEQVDFQRVVLVTSPGFTRRGVTARVSEALGARLVAVLDDVKPNPDVLDVDAQARVVRGLAPDCILALGGGSSMDTAKALARLLTQPADATLAGHFRDGEAFGDRRALPVITVPTTAGTGAEVTPFGTIWDFERKKKYSVTGNDLYSCAAILDPELTAGLPHEVTVSSGLDAVSHALESAWNRHANPVTLGFVTASLRLSLDALPQLAERPDDLALRGAMMQASLLAGMAISQTRTALAHSISYPLTTSFGLPHGIACSFTLPALMDFNAEADDGRLYELARALGREDIADLSQALCRLFNKLDVGNLFRNYVRDVSAARELAGEMILPGRAGNNLRDASTADVENLLAIALRHVEQNYA